MKKPPVQISKDDVEKALSNTAWDLGNQVLYDLCSKHPFHKTPQEIIAKVWLIGRSYAAALERRKNKRSDSSIDATDRGMKWFSRTIKRVLAECNKKLPYFQKS